MDQKDFREIEEYAVKKSLERITADNETGKILIQTIARVCALSIAEYDRKHMKEKKNDE